MSATIDRQARHVDEREAGLGQYGFGQSGDAADDVDADADRVAGVRELVGKACDVGWRVEQFAVDLHDAIGVDGSHPVYLLGDVDPDADPHDDPWQLKVQHPARAVFTPHSDESQSLISGRGGVAVPGDLPPEPSRAVSVKTIPAPPPRHDAGMPASWRQALLAQHLNGRVA